MVAQLIPTYRAGQALSECSSAEKRLYFTTAILSDIRAGFPQIDTVRVVVLKAHTKGHHLQVPSLRSGRVDSRRVVTSE